MTRVILANDLLEESIGQGQLTQPLVVSRELRVVKNQYRLKFEYSRHKQLTNTNAFHLFNLC